VGPGPCGLLGVPSLGYDHDGLEDARMEAWVNCRAETTCGSDLIDAGEFLSGLSSWRVQGAVRRCVRRHAFPHRP